MSDSTRQHYNLARGKGLTDAPSRSGSPGYARGGKVAGGGVCGVPNPKAPSGFKATPKSR